MPDTDPAPPVMATISARTRFQLPGTCRLCRRWGPPLCADCLATWARPAARCRRCGIGLDSGPSGDECPACRSVPPAMTRTIVLADYRFPWDRAVHRLKFGAEPEWAAVVAPPLAERIRASGADQDIHGVLPVPLSPRRLTERGYNQAWELARCLGRCLGLPAFDGLLTRFRHTESQVALHRDERARNLQDAFGVEPHRTADVARRRWALVDDVITTGATVGAAAQALLAAGAQRVDVWAVARTPA